MPCNFKLVGGKGSIASRRIRASTCIACLPGNLNKKRPASLEISIRSTADSEFSPHVFVSVVDTFYLRSLHRLQVIKILQPLA